MFGRRILATAALVAACAQAQVSITNPGPNSWWVASSVNTLAWTCDTSPYSEYTVVVTNSDTSILASPFALIASVPNYDCSLTVDQQQSFLAVSTTWTISLASNVNISDIYASAQFEVKAAGSPYAVSSSTASSGSSATSSAGSASSTSTSSTGAGSANYIPVGMSMVAALVLGLTVA